MTGQKQLGNVEYFNCLDSTVASGAICTREIESKIALAKQHSTKFASKLDLNVRKNLVKCYMWSVACIMLKLRILLTVDQKYP
jgi:hypothetical protein